MATVYNSRLTHMRLVHPKVWLGPKVILLSKEDGTVFDTSISRDPLQFTIGEGQIIPGVELQATYPEDLARHDISDEDLDALSGEERF